jgi:hypothetical protein
MSRSSAFLPALGTVLLLLSACAPAQPAIDPGVDSLPLENSSAYSSVAAAASSLPETAPEASSPSAPVPVPAPASSSAAGSAMSAVSLSSASGGLTASKTVAVVLQGWISQKGDAIAAGAYRSNPYLTESFRASLDAAPTMASVFCAPRKPPAFGVTATHAAGGEATVTLGEDYKDQTLSLQFGLKKQDGIWKIDTLQCPTGTSSSH